MDSPQRPRIRVAVALLHQDRLLLVQHTKSDRSYWLLPGGGLEWGEEIKEAATRELFEETGYRCEVGQLLLVSTTVAPDGSRHLLHLVFCAQLLGGERRVPEETRITDVAWIPWADVPQLVLHPPLQEVFGNMDPRRLEFRDEDEIFLGNLWVD